MQNYCKFTHLYRVYVSYTSCLFRCRMMWPITVDQTAQLGPLITTSSGDVSSPRSLPQTGHNNGQGCLAFQLHSSGDLNLIITLPFVWLVNLESRMREQKNVFRVISPMRWRTWSWGWSFCVAYKHKLNQLMLYWQSNNNEAGCGLHVCVVEHSIRKVSLKSHEMMMMLGQQTWSATMAFISSTHQWCTVAKNWTNTRTCRQTLHQPQYCWLV